MAKLIWGVYCQQAIVDRTTNGLTLINQLDEVHPPRPPDNLTGPNGKKAIPLAPFPSVVVTVWERDNRRLSEIVHVQGVLIGPNKKSLIKFEQRIDLKKTPRGRLFGNLPGLPLVGQGTYRFVFRARKGTSWKRAGEIPFEVIYVPNPVVH